MTPGVYVSVLFTPTGKLIDLPAEECDNSQMLGLLIAGKQGATEISKMMFKAPGIDFALVNSVVHEGQYVYTVSIRVATPKLEELWQWIFATNNVPLLARGLFAVVMQSGTFIWLRGKGIHTYIHTYIHTCVKKKLFISDARPVQDITNS